MSELIATPIIKNKFWVVEDQGEKIATIQARDDGGFVYVHEDFREHFSNVNTLKKTYNIKFGANPGGSDYLDYQTYASGLLSVRNIITMTSPAAYAVAQNPSNGSISGNNYVTAGTWDSRLQITGFTTFESDWTTLNSMTNGVYAATWADGTRGYVYLENPGSTGGFVDLAVCDSGGANPGPAGTYVFPVVLSPEV